MSKERPPTQAEIDANAVQCVKDLQAAREKEKIRPSPFESPEGTKKRLGIE